MVVKVKNLYLRAIILPITIGKIQGNSPVIIKLMVSRYSMSISN